MPAVAMAAASPVNMLPTEMWEEKRIWRGPPAGWAPGSALSEGSWMSEHCCISLPSTSKCRTYSVCVEAEPSVHEYLKHRGENYLTLSLNQEPSQKILISGQAILTQGLSDLG